MAHLLSIRDSFNWDDISQLFGVLLSFMTDSRIKVSFFFILLICFPILDSLSYKKS